MKKKTSIKSGKYFYDTNGKLIQAHGGQIVPYNGKYYWFGEDKEGIVGRATGDKDFSRWHNGIRLYVSEDLINWEDKGIVCVDNKGDKLTPFNPACITERPHVIYNEKTKKFVMWVKLCGPCDYSIPNYACRYGVAVADTIDGQYTFLREELNGFGGDFDIFEYEGNGYIIGEKPHDALCLYHLDDTYTKIVGCEEYFKGVIPPYIPEAPCFINRNGNLSLVCSHTTGYFPNPTFYVQMESLFGKWQRGGNVCRNDIQNNSFNSQISCIFKIPNRNLYVALADRWLVDLPPQYESPIALYDRMFKGDGSVHNILGGLTDQNTSLATYCFYPVFFDDDGTPYVQWIDSWKLEDFYD